MKAKSDTMLRLTPNSGRNSSEPRNEIGMPMVTQKARRASRKMAQQDKHQRKAHVAVAQQQVQALAVDVRAVVEGRHPDSRRQVLAQTLHVLQDRVGHRDGGLVPHPVDVDHHRRLAVVSRGGVGVLEPVDDGGDLLEAHLGARVGGDDRDLGKLPPVVPPLLHAHQDLPALGFQPAPGQLHRCGSDLVGNLLQGQVVGPQPGLGHFDADLEGAHGRQHHLGDAAVLQETVAGRFGHFPQHPFVLVAVKDHRDHLPAPGSHHHLGLFGLLGKGGDAVDLALDILPQPLQVGTGEHLHGHGPNPFLGAGGHFADALKPLDGLFDRQHDALLDLLGAGAGVGHRHGHQVQVEFRKDLLLDPASPDQPAHQKEEHQQVGGDRVAGHPGHGTPFGGM